jgi:hypothetical protein
MRLKLNTWQRALLLVAAGGILWVTFYQFIEYGLEVFEWLLPVIVAVALAFVAVSRSGRDREPKERISFGAVEVVSGMALCNDRIFRLIPTPRIAQDQSSGCDPQKLGESLLLVRATIYSYVIAVIAAQRADPGFHNSAALDPTTNAFFDLAKKAWLRRFGKNVTDFPDAQAKTDFSREYLRATELYGSVASRIANTSPAPFEPLYRYIEMRPEASAQELEEKYGPTTRGLVRDLELRFKQAR